MTCVHTKLWVCQSGNSLQVTSNSVFAMQGRPAYELNVLYVSPCNRFIVGLFENNTRMVVRAALDESDGGEELRVRVFDLHRGSLQAVGIASSVLQGAMDLTVQALLVKRDLVMASVARTAEERGSYVMLVMADEVPKRLPGVPPATHEKNQAWLHSTMIRLVTECGDDSLFTRETI